MTLKILNRVVGAWLLAISGTVLAFSVRAVVVFGSSMWYVVLALLFFVGFAVAAVRRW